MTEDYVALRGLEFHARHGLHAFEKENGNHFVMDVFMYSNLEKAGTTDDVSATVDYSKAYDIIATIMNGPSQNLMEALLEEIALNIRSEFPTLQKLTLRIKKMSPPVGGLCEASEIQRTWLIA